MKIIIRTILDILLFIIAFVVVQTVVQIGVALVWSGVKDLPYENVMNSLVSGSEGWLLAVSTVISSVLVVLLFALCRWTPLSRTWLRSHPWGVLVWVVLASIGTIIPSEWIYEQMQIQMPEEMEALFEGIMKEPWGYVAIGICAPIAEEVVFRGAILRSLLNVMGGRMHWVAIALSALVFGAVHLNVAQGSHAFVLGLLLGWMYYRTGSIFPGIVLHWVNNSVAYVMYNLMPEAKDGQLIDLFHGSDVLMYGGLVFSLCILLPSLFQLNMRMRKEIDGVRRR